MLLLLNSFLLLLDSFVIYSRLVDPSVVHSTPERINPFHFGLMCRPLAKK